MQLLILTTLISFIAGSNFEFIPEFGRHGKFAENAVRGALHAPSNNCNNGVENIGTGSTNFDNSCQNTAVEANTDDHSNSNNKWDSWPLNNK
jgi:hypothetical protein